MVFYSCLMMLFLMFCFKCKAAKPTVESLKNGSMITVLQHCPNCGNNAFKWSSQPLMFGKFPAGNILLSFGVLVAGASISKVLLVFKHIGMAAHVRTFFRHQNDFILPSILKYWEESHNSVINKIKSVGNVTWSGDGRFDSMGHCAKYGLYTMLCSPLDKIVHFELIQVYGWHNAYKISQA